MEDRVNYKLSPKHLQTGASPQNYESYTLKSPKAQSVHKS